MRSLLVAAFGLHVNDAMSEQMHYPWAKSHDRNFHFEGRQNEILNSLRNNIQMEMLSDKLPFGMDADHAIYVRNSENQKYTCEVKVDLPVESALVTTNDEDESMAAFQKSFAVINRLKNMCMINAVDWWSYEWCHRKEVKQFHMDVDHKEKKHFRNPEFSLGTYVYSDYYSNEFDEETVEEVIDYYEGGQWCDEIEDGRKTEVHLRCCSQDALVVQYKNADGIPPANIVSFQQIRETKMCNYQIDLCTPLLCEEIQHADRPDKLRSLSLVEFFDQFRHVCMQRQENWWSYEVCFGGGDGPESEGRGLGKSSSQSQSDLKSDSGTNMASDASSTSKPGAEGEVMASKKGGKVNAVVTMEKNSKKKAQHSPVAGVTPAKFQGIRQFHMETILLKTDKENEMLQQQVVQGEFILGRPPLELYLNETALLESVRAPAKSPASLREYQSLQPRLSSLHVEFTGGSECDLMESTGRSATVEVSCGDRDFIEDIIEDRTCHYVIKMTSKLICRVEGFSAPKKEVTEVMCTSDDEVEGKNSDDNRDSSGETGSDRDAAAAATAAAGSCGTATEDDGSRSSSKHRVKMTRGGNG